MSIEFPEIFREFINEDGAVVTFDAYKSCLIAKVGERLDLYDLSAVQTENNVKEKHPQIFDAYLNVLSKWEENRPVASYVGLTQNISNKLYK